MYTCYLPPTKSIICLGRHEKYVAQFVSSCTVCQQAKAKRVKYLGLLQPLPIPSGAQQTISMDFVEWLAMLDGKNCVLVVVDKFSMFGHFFLSNILLQQQWQQKKIMQQIYKFHGMPSAIVTNRDKIFTSQLSKSLFALAGVSLNISSAYDPQSDGQTERVNQCLEPRYFVRSSDNINQYRYHVKEVTNSIILFSYYNNY